MATRAISGKSAASLAIAVLSVGLWSFTDLPALTAGVAALLLAVFGLWDIGRSQGRLKGKGLAVAGIVVEAAAMLVFLLLVPAVGRVREAAQRLAST
jgi:hypothetical protein